MKTKNKGSISLGNLQRLRIAIDVLNAQKGTPIKGVDFLSLINSIATIPACKSQFEKDIFKLREDFDAPIKAGKKGYYLDEPFDFFESLKNAI